MEKFTEFELNQKMILAHFGDNEFKVSETGKVEFDVGKYYDNNSDKERNKDALSLGQILQAVNYAVDLGIERRNVVYKDYEYTAINKWGILYIGLDLYPKKNTLSATRYANSRVSWRGVIAHEIVGHYEAGLENETLDMLCLEEGQASIRAARFAPELTMVERITALRDGIMRLYNSGFKAKEVKDNLFISKRRRDKFGNN